MYYKFTEAQSMTHQAKFNLTFLSHDSSVIFESDR